MKDSGLNKIGKNKNCEVLKESEKDILGKGVLLGFPFGFVFMSGRKK